MAMYLLTWNPSRWSWDDLPETVAEVRRFGRVPGRWSCGRTRRILEGDRLFLLRQGRDRPGLIASAWATSGSPLAHVGKHWDRVVPRGQKALYVDLDWDVLSTEPIIGRGELLARFPSVHWNTQMSGIAIDTEAARALEREWGRRVG